jgi:hypothetical protein
MDFGFSDISRQGYVPRTWRVDIAANDGLKFIRTKTYSRRAIAANAGHDFIYV